MNFLNKLLLATILLSLQMGVHGAEPKAPLVGKEKIVIQVKGMVCAFCAQGIEKNFSKLESVKETKVDLNSMEVTVQMKKGKKLSEEAAKKVITDAGFSYVGMK